MRLRFGVTPLGGVNTRAAALAMGVSQRTVQRWLRAPSGRAKAPIPAARLAQLIELLVPESRTLRAEQKAAVYARRAIAQVALPRGMGILPSWQDQGWLTQHMVAVLGMANPGIRQLTIARATLDRIGEVQRRGRVLDYVIVPTWFHATVLVQELLQDLEPWRYQASKPDVKQGFTWVWLDDAPPVDLAAAAAALRLR